MIQSIEAWPNLESAEFHEITLELSNKVKQTARTALDISYGSHERQSLDIFLPDEQVGSLPVLIFIHGGYWTLGSKDWMGFIAPAITILPAIYISIGYRLTPEVKYPQPIEDCRAALKWIYENINNYGGDLNRIFIAGHSAGGHLASMVTLQKDKLVNLGLPEDVIKGCFSVSGIYDVADTVPERRDLFVSSPEEAKEASPLSHLKGNTTPFLLAVGENDFPYLIDQFFTMGKALKSEDCTVDTIYMPGLNHFQMNLANGIVDGPWAAKVREWLAAIPNR